MSQNYDKKFISYALNLAKKNLGITAPNPVVACVIVKNDEIISIGITAKNGRPHAEKIAIDKISLDENGRKKLENSTLYVTLEPCSHFGQTAPCVDEIIKNKIKKVIIATSDIDERVNGKGIEKLLSAGIEVVVGVMEKEAQEINKGFFKSKKSGIPYITLKIASSLDGKIATKNFDSKWITSEAARYFSQSLRAKNDAIMVGANTVKKDNPSLDCRISGLEDYSPKRVIIAGDLNFDEQLKIFQTAIEIPTIILTYEQDFDTKKLKDLGVEIIFLPKNNNGRNNKIDLLEACKKLSAQDINSVLIEGGQNLATQFLQENLVDELVWIRNKKIIGNDGIAAIGELGLSSINEALSGFEKKETQILEEDIIEIFRKI
jgi:diaminohydroxyphosphoribosylaminopyrimidine deaminase/5-amino-6-(5-phosphoribosylamino)uracil reductase